MEQFRASMAECVHVCARVHASVCRRSSAGLCGKCVDVKVAQQAPQPTMWQPSTEVLEQLEAQEESHVKGSTHLRFETESVEMSW